MQVDERMTASLVQRPRMCVSLFLHGIKFMILNLRLNSNLIRTVLKLKWHRSDAASMKAGLDLAHGLTI